MSNKYLKKLRNQAQRQTVVKTSYELYKTFGMYTFNILKKSLRMNLGNFRKPDRTIEDELHEVWYPTMRWGYRTAGKQFFSSTDFHLLVCEMIWKRSGSSVIFVEDRRMPDMINRAKYDIIPEAMYIPCGPFVSFAFPVGTKIDNKEIHGCIFGEMTTESYRNILRKEINVIEPGLGDIINYGGDYNFEGYSGPCLYVIVTVKDEHEGIRHIRTWFPKSDVKKALDTGLLDLQLKERNDWFLPPTHDEMLNQRMYLKICSGLCFYISAFKDCFTSGIPENSVIQGKMTSERSSVLSLPTEYRNSPDIHLRSPHIRTLRHEKYGLDENGRYRTVPVNSCIVGGKVDSRIVSIKRGMGKELILKSRLKENSRE